MVAKQLTLAGGLGVLVIGSMFSQAKDLNENYTRIDAKIKTVSVDCHIENSTGKVVEKGKKSIAHMDCGLAPFVARQNGFTDKDIKQRAQVTYLFRSPVDGNYYTGDFTRSGDISKYTSGAEIEIYAHKENPEKSKTPSGNIFLADKNV